jgi:photosystem II stability/assembly factor-like uncharacterized protein
MRFRDALLILLSALIMTLTTSCGSPKQTAKPTITGDGGKITVATDTVFSESFVDPMHGWVVLGQEAPPTADGGNTTDRIRVLATTDGGNTWSQASTLEGESGDIGFVSAKQGWLMTGTKGLAFFDFTGDGLKSTDDGGKTWYDESIPQESGISVSQAQFVDAEHGWLLGTYKSNHNVIVWSTADGGKTWSRMNVSAQIKVAPASCYLSFISPEQGWLVIGSQPGAGGQPKYLYRTLDGGRHWTEVAHDVDGDFSSPENGMPVTGYVVGLDFLNCRVGWLTNARGFVCLTTDGGYTWKTLGQYSDLSDSGLQHPDFLDVEHGFAISSDILMATSDGGVTWRQVNVGA